MSGSEKISLILLATTSAFALSSAAHAGITVVNGPFVTPTAYNGFEGIGPHAGSSQTPTWSGPYTEGNLTVQHIGGDQVVTTYQAEGLYSWYDGSGLGGYTSIKLADGGVMDEFQFDATTQLIQPIGAGIPFYYQLLLGGQVVATGSAGSLCDTQIVCFKTYGFEGGTFDEVRLQSNIFLDQFDPNAPQADTLLVDNLFAREVPEPTTWALMIAGLGIVGSALRRQGRRAAVSFA